MALTRGSEAVQASTPLPHPMMTRRSSSRKTAGKHRRTSTTTTTTTTVTSSTLVKEGTGSSTGSGSSSRRRSKAVDVSVIAGGAGELLDGDFHFDGDTEVEEGDEEEDEEDEVTISKSVRRVNTRTSRRESRASALLAGQNGGSSSSILRKSTIYQGAQSGSGQRARQLQLYELDGGRSVNVNFVAVGTLRSEDTVEAQWKQAHLPRAEQRLSFVAKMATFAQTLLTTVVWSLAAIVYFASTFMVWLDLWVLHKLSQVMRAMVVFAGLPLISPLARPRAFANGMWGFIKSGRWLLLLLLLLPFFLGLFGGLRSHRPIVVTGDGVQDNELLLRLMGELSELRAKVDAGNLPGLRDMEVKLDKVSTARAKEVTDLKAQIGDLNLLIAKLGQDSKPATQDASKELLDKVRFLELQLANLEKTPSKGVNTLIQQKIENNQVLINLQKKLQNLELNAGNADAPARSDSDTAALREEIRTLEASLIGKLEASKPDIDGALKGEKERVAALALQLKQLQDSFQGLKLQDISESSMTNIINRVLKHEAIQVAIQSTVSESKDSQILLHKTEMEEMEERVRAKMRAYMDEEISRVKAGGGKVDMKSVVNLAVEELKAVMIQPSTDEITHIVDTRLWHFEADKTGKPDYALATQGASVKRSQCEEPTVGSLFSYLRQALGSARIDQSASAMIHPEMSVGNCWAFKGDAAQTIIELSHVVVIQEISIEHIQQSVAPVNDIRSAPKDFNVYGLQSDDERSLTGTLLLSGQYDVDVHKPPLQYFHVNAKQLLEKTPFKFVRLEFMSNHGNDAYTCVYRFRVHGQPVDAV